MTTAVRRCKCRRPDNSVGEKVKKTDTLATDRNLTKANFVAGWQGSQKYGGEG
jgi:hypothetical protein